MSQSLVKLKKEWYKKLKDSGFRDIEKANGSIGRTQLNLENRNFDQIQATQDYYSLARAFILEYPFKNETEKTIWTMHSEGASYRKIADKLKQENISIEKSKIGNVVSSISKLMKQKYIK